MDRRRDAASFHHSQHGANPRLTIPPARRVVQDDRDLLAHCNLFRVLADDERDTLFAHAHIRRCAAEETIFLMGSPGDSMMVVLSGHVRISVSSPDGREILLALLSPGEIFGEIAMFDGKERTADARAASECRLATLYRRDVFAFFAQHPDAWSGVLCALCDRLRSADEQVAEMALMSLPVRLAKALLRMTAVEAPPREHPPQVRLTQREIGCLVGATRESVNKWLGRWQRKGIIHIAETQITITDRHALEELAQIDSNQAICCP